MLERWRPVPDPGRPNCPYLPGLTVDIQPHTAPEPFRADEYPQESTPRDPAPSTWLRKTPQTEVVLKYPPVETTQSIRESSPSSLLTVTKVQSIGNGRGPQLVLCSITPATGAAYMAMAKIYDGLYYPFGYHLAPGPRDPCLDADQDYSIEVAAYNELQQAGLVGGFTPELYGSYTFAISLQYNGVTHTRSVRMILVEALDGCSIRDLFARNSPIPSDPPNGHHYSEEFRLAVMAKIMDGEVKQFNQAISLHDLAPRNVVIENPYAKHNTIPRVVLVDYD